MTMQSVCHSLGQCAVATMCLSLHSASAASQDSKHDFPTHARVEYVQECIARNQGKLASLYQCSCVIDELAKHFPYDDYVEAATFARYASLGGDRGAEFRDPERGKKLAKDYRAAEEAAAKRCGLKQ